MLTIPEIVKKLNTLIDKTESLSFKYLYQELISNLENPTIDYLVIHVSSIVNEELKTLGFKSLQNEFGDPIISWKDILEANKVDITGPNNMAKEMNCLATIANTEHGCKLQEDMLQHVKVSIATIKFNIKTEAGKGRNFYRFSLDQKSLTPSKFRTSIDLIIGELEELGFKVIYDRVGLNIYIGW